MGHYCELSLESVANERALTITDYYWLSDWSKIIIQIVIHIIQIVIQIIQTVDCGLYRLSLDGFRTTISIFDDNWMTY